jgi:putative modified peptide
MPYNFSEEFVDRLLDKLGGDDAFRKQFQADPRAAVESLGHRVSPGDAADLKCLKCDALADKEDMQASRAKLRKELLSSTAAQMPISLAVQRKS